MSFASDREIVKTSLFTTSLVCDCFSICCLSLILYIFLKNTKKTSCAFVLTEDGCKWNGEKLDLIQGQKLILLGKTERPLDGQTWLWEMAVCLPRAAAVQWAIMKPEFRPPSATRKAGSSLREGLQSLSILLSLIAASSWTPMAK